MDEIRSIIEDIRAFHVSKGRKVARYFKRPLPEGERRPELERLAFPELEAWACLYGTFDGVDPGDNLTLASGSVLLEWEWLPLAMLRRGYEARGSRPPLYFGMSRGASPDLAVWPSACGREHGQVIQCTSIVRLPLAAFDGVLPMLRTIHAAYSRDLVSYDENDEIVYDKSTVGHLAAEFNVHTDYWQQFT